MTDKLAGQIQAEAETAIRDLIRLYGYDSAMEIIAAMLLKERARRGYANV